jgi:hypothetical protein
MRGEGALPRAAAEPSLSMRSPLAFVDAYGWRIDVWGRHSSGQGIRRWTMAGQSLSSPDRPPDRRGHRPAVGEVSGLRGPR